MKPRHTAPSKKVEPAKKPAEPQIKQPIDELGVIRGQNAEKRDTVRPENIPGRTDVEH